MSDPRIEYAVLPAGDGPGQDRCFTADGLVVVLDGASAHDSTISPDAGEYVDLLGAALICRITGRPDIDLRVALAEAIRSTAGKLRLVRGQGPSSTVSIARWQDQRLDVLVLGDSPVVVRFRNAAETRLVQQSMKVIAADLRRKYCSRLAEGYGFDAEHRSILADIQRQEALSRNLSGGYFIAEADSAAADHATCSGWEVDEVDHVILKTDGAELLEHYPPWSSVDFKALPSAGLSSVLREIHLWEADVDPNGKLFPRSKRHDDKAIAVMARRSLHK